VLVPIRRESKINGCVSGPHLLLAVAMVKLAVRDLDDPRFSAGAKAFLRGEPYEGSKPEVEADLIADVLGYGGKWETNG
jgi:hypothetical protein